MFNIMGIMNGIDIIEQNIKLNENLNVDRLSTIVVELIMTSDKIF